MMNNKTRLIAWFLPLLWMGLGGGLFAQDLTVCAGKGFTLTSADDATSAGVVTYTWQENGQELQNSNAATYHISGKTAGTYNYVRRAITEDCPEGAPSNTYTVQVNPAPEILSLTSATICYGGNVTLTATMGGGTTSAMTYTWIVGGGAAQTTTDPTLTTQTLTEDTAFTLTVTNANGCTGAEYAGTITVNDLPAIILTSGNDSQTIALDDAITQIQYTITNASATATGLPDGVSGEWSSNVYTISGTPTSAGTYNYTVTTTNDKGCANTAIGKIIVVPVPPYSIGNTWSCDSQIWSGALRNPASCPQQSSLSADEQPPAQYYDRGSSYGYYYNWTCVYENATTLCPSPWRVPTDNDLSTLVSCAEKNHSLDGSLWLGAWGPTGYVATSEFVESPTGHVWSQTAEPPPYAVCLLYDTNGVGIVADYRAVGFPVRCVR